MIKLTPKQRTFVAAYIETGSGPDAAIRAYNCRSRNSARVLAHRNLHNPKIVAAIEEVLAKHGVHLKAVDALNGALEATKTVYTDPKTGERIEGPDHRTRLAAADKVFKMLDAYPLSQGVLEEVWEEANEQLTHQRTKTSDEP